MSSRTAIIRTTFESGLKRIDHGQCRAEGEDGLNTLSIVRQSDDRQRAELNDLNGRLKQYVDRVKGLEELNRQLEATFFQLKNDAFSGISKNHGEHASLNRLRSSLDQESNDRAQILAKHIWHLESDRTELNHKTNFELGRNSSLLERINFLNEGLRQTASSIVQLRRLIEESNPENDKDDAHVTSLQQAIEQLSALHRDYAEKLQERKSIEISLQTAEETLAFLKALNEEESSELDRFRKCQQSDSTFYDNELVSSIAAIRKDFDELKRQSVKQFEQFYIAKTEIIKQKFNDERQRTNEQLETEESRYTNSTDALNSELDDIKDQISCLIRESNAFSDEAYGLEQRLLDMQHRHRDQQYKLRSSCEALEKQMIDLEQTIATVGESNVTLAFEIHTYRRLLEGEEAHYMSSGGTTERSNAGISQQQHQQQHTFRTQLDVMTSSSTTQQSSETSGTDQVARKVVEESITGGKMEAKKLLDDLQQDLKRDSFHQDHVTITVRKNDPLYDDPMANISEECHIGLDGTATMQSGAWMTMSQQNETANARKIQDIEVQPDLKNHHARTASLITSQLSNVFPNKLDTVMFSSSVSRMLPHEAMRAEKAAEGEHAAEATFTEDRSLRSAQSEDSLYHDTVEEQQPSVDISEDTVSIADKPSNETAPDDEPLSDVEQTHTYQIRRPSLSPQPETSEKAEVYADYQVTFKMTLGDTKPCSVVIEEIRKDGSVMVLHNDGDEPVPLNEWCISQSYGATTLDETAAVYCYLPEDCSIKSKSRLKIFSKAGEQVALDLSPESTVLVRNVEYWLVGPDIETKLISSDGKIRYKINGSPPTR